MLLPAACLSHPCRCSILHSCFAALPTASTATQIVAACPSPDLRLNQPGRLDSWTASGHESARHDVAPMPCSMPPPPCACTVQDTASDEGDFFFTVEEETDEMDGLLARGSVPHGRSWREAATAELAREGKKEAWRDSWFFFFNPAMPSASCSEAVQEASGPVQ